MKKNTVKKMISLVAALAMTASLAACSNSDEMQKILDYLDSLHEQMEGHQEQLSFLRDFHPHTTSHSRQDSFDCDETSCCDDNAANNCENSDPSCDN